MKIHPLNIIMLGLLLCSLGFNVLLWDSNRKLIYKVQKLEAGPAQGLFLNRETPLPKEIDKELDDLIKRMIKQALNETTT